MIARLEGSLFSKTPTLAVIDVSGVGYEVNIPLSTFTRLPDEGKTVALRVQTQVRDDALQLFGFATEREHRAFGLLLRAARVGPRLAQTILSGIEAGALMHALAEGDASSLERVPGIGAKTARRLVVELRERAVEARSLDSSSQEGASLGVGDVARDQLLSALANLQVPRARAERLVDEVVEACGPGASIEALVRCALPRLAR